MYYQHIPEIWNAKKCARIAKRKQRDSFNTLDHLPGFIRGSYGLTRYNGGCVRENKWYPGENYPLPEIAAGFKIIYVKSWFFRLIKLT